MWYYVATVSAARGSSRSPVPPYIIRGLRAFKSGTEMDDRMPPNEYSEYFGPAATLHPKGVREKENQNSPRFLEQVIPLTTKLIADFQAVD